MQWINDKKNEFIKKLKEKGFNSDQIKDILLISSNYVGAIGASGYSDDIEELDYFIKILRE